MKYGSSGIPL